MKGTFLGFLLLLLLGCARVGCAADLPWLRADGSRIVDAGGKPVVLRGVNLGGWLVEEIWMMPFASKPPEGSRFKPITDYTTLWGTIDARFGAAETHRLRTALRNAWLSEADFDRFRAAGFNCVRLPFLHDQMNEPGGLFPWLDRAIGWAEKRGMYVILDLHGAPGRQSKDHHTGEAGVNRLFHDPVMVARTEEVWKQVARRYRNRPAVAAYDLLNEPMGAPTNSTLYLVQDRLYRAIRSVDSRHLIIFEDGYKGIENMPDPAVAGWQNVVYSIHSYKFDAKSEQDHRQHLQWLVGAVEKKQKERPVPFFLGEFNLEPHGTPEVIATFVKTLTGKGWSWSLWTYKVAGPPGGRSLWGWYYVPRGVQVLDPYRDSPAELVRKMEQVRTENMQEHQELGRALRTAGP